jgi:MFS family permease
MSTQPTSRRELAALVLTGAAGAAVALLAVRMPVARLHVLAPRPLPASVQAITVADVRPAAAALAVAALASMLAVLATRSVARRIVGVVAAGLAAGLVAMAVSPIGAAQLVAEAGRGSSSATAAGGGSAVGSVTAGSGASRPGGGLSGFPEHLVLAGVGWRAVLLAGAIGVLAAGLLVVLRADRLPAMSARYDRQAPAGSRQVALWDALSAGADPTSGSADEAGLPAAPGAGSAQAGRVAVDTIGTPGQPTQGGSETA